MKTSIERLVLMVNQIAANLSHESDPAGATAAHIVTFWDPRMKAMIVGPGVAGLSPVGAAAVAQLSVGV